MVCFTHEKFWDCSDESDITRGQDIWNQEILQRVNSSSSLLFGVWEEIRKGCGRNQGSCRTGDMGWESRKSLGGKTVMKSATISHHLKTWLQVGTHNCWSPWQSWDTTEPAFMDSRRRLREMEWLVQTHQTYKDHSQRAKTYNLPFTVHSWCLHPCMHIHARDNSVSLFPTWFLYSDYTPSQLHNTIWNLMAQNLIILT